LSSARGCRSRWPDELRNEPWRRISPGRRVHRPDSQGREARRPAGLAVEQIRVRHQRANGEIARHRSAQRVATARRRGDRVKRREFITLLGGAAASPIAARAQQADKVRHIGVLMNVAATDPEGQAQVAAFLQTLQQLGWSEGRNVRIETRWGENDVELDRTYAKELLALAPDIILASSTLAV